MRRTVAAIASCLAYAGSSDAEEIFVRNGIDEFHVEQPAPAELVRALSPWLDASGTEELRASPVDVYPENADLIDGRGRPVQTTLRFDQFIAGREVRQAYVLIGFNTRTNAVTLLNARFLPDRELDHTPRLTQAQARAKAAAMLRKRAERLEFDDAPARLAYEFKPSGEFGGRDGVLTWIFGARRLDWEDPHEVSVSAANGKVVRVRAKTAGCFDPAEWMDLPLDSFDPRTDKDARLPGEPR